MFEFWFPFSEIEFTRKRKIWCDGVLHLEVQELNPVSFLIAGIGYFPRSISPFEIEFSFHSNSRRDPSIYGAAIWATR